MKRLLKNPASLPRAFVIFIASITFLAGAGGYQLSRLIHEMHDSSFRRAEQLLIVGENLEAAADGLKTQVQEWKNMLLRVNDPALFSRHRTAFSDSSVNVQFALLRTKTAMEKAGMDVGIIDPLIREHKLLVASYLVAQAELDPKRIESARLADKRVIGADRLLQQHLEELRVGVEELAEQELNGAVPEQERRYWLTGLLGAVSLLVMALIGFLFASWFYARDSRAMGHLAAS